MELVVGDDLTLSALLIDQDTVLEGYDGVGIASCLTLWDNLSVIVTQMY